MHRVLFGGDHIAWPRHGPRSAPKTRQTGGVISALPADKIPLNRRVGVFRALDLGIGGSALHSVKSSSVAVKPQLHKPLGHDAAGLQSVLDPRSLSKQSSEASVSTTRSCAATPLRIRDSKDALDTANKSPSPSIRVDVPMGNKQRLGVLGVLSKYWQPAASPSSTSKHTSATSVSSCVAPYACHQMHSSCWRAPC